MTDPFFPYMVPLQSFVFGATCLYHLETLAEYDTAFLDSEALATTISKILGHLLTRVKDLAYQSWDPLATRDLNYSGYSWS